MTDRILKLIPRRFLRRGTWAQSLEIAGLAAIVQGVQAVAGYGVAMIVGGILLVLLAFEVER